MSTIIASPEVTTSPAILRALGAALDPEQWRYCQYSWGIDWEAYDDRGDRYAVALVTARREVEVYKPGEDLAAVLVFDGRCDGDPATLASLPEILDDLDLPYVEVPR